MEVLSLMNSHRKEWDAMLNEWKVVQDIDLVTQIRYELYHGVWVRCIIFMDSSKFFQPTAPRDICSLNTFRVLDDNLVVTVGCSTKHDNCSEINGNVRAELRIGGSVIRGLPNGRSQISLVMDLDVGGSVPAAVLKMISFNGPLTISQLSNFIPEARQNNLIRGQEYLDIWMKYCELQSHIHQTPGIVTPPELKEVQEEPKIEPPPISPKVQLKVEDGIIFEQGTQEHASFLESSNQSLLRQWRQSNSSNWKQEKGSSNVSMYVLEADPLTTMAIIDIDGPPLNILTLIVDSTRRRDWDSCFDSFRDVDTVSSVTAIEQWFFKFPWVS
jgi:hypothetical protein